MKLTSNLYEANAEMLLDYLYPELQQQWVVRQKGTFYRNYNSDLLSVDEEQVQAKLSRNGFLRLLPEGLFNSEDDLRSNNVKEDHQEIMQRMRILEEAFLPFDSFYFRARLQLERSVSELLDTKLEFVLKHFFDIDLSSLNNPYVREIAVLLPFIHQLKGNLTLVRMLLSDLLGCEVRMIKGRYTMSDLNIGWLPSIDYHLLMPNLNVTDFCKKQEEIAPLIEFVKQWFIPFEMVCKISIKEYNHEPQLQGLLLNYNTHL